MSMNFLTITLPSFLSCLPLRFCMWCTWYVNTGVTSYQRFWLCRLQSENIQWRIPKFNHLLFLVVWWNLASPGPRQSLFPASPRAAAARPSRHLGRPVLGGQPRSRRDFGALLVSLNDGSKVRKWWRWQFGYTKRGQKVLFGSETVKVLDLGRENKSCAEAAKTYGRTKPSLAESAKKREANYRPLEECKLAKKNAFAKFLKTF